VADCARANLLALEKGSGQTYNLGAGIGTTINEIFSGLKGITNYPLDARHGPPKAGETFRIFLTAARAQKDLGWQPTVNLQEGLERTVAYFREAEVKK
jgi:UDP-glucose 4-epimerase